MRRISPKVACTIRGPRLARRTPRASSSPSGGAGGPAMTFRGPAVSRASRSIVPASLTWGTNRQSAPAAREAVGRRAGGGDPPPRGPLFHFEAYGGAVAAHGTPGPPPPPRHR